RRSYQASLFNWIAMIGEPIEQQRCCASPGVRHRTPALRLERSARRHHRAFQSPQNRVGQTQLPVARFALASVAKTRESFQHLASLIADFTREDHGKSQ